jgi:hypothetical protein
MSSINTILKNIVRFTGLVLDTPTVLPHLLNINGHAVLPDLVAGNAEGFKITANETTVTVTRTAAATSGDVDVYLEHWHTIEEVVPPDELAGKIPFIINGNPEPFSNPGPIAAAFVNAFNGGAQFLSQYGFSGPPNRSAAGVYTLTLSNPPPAQFQLVVTALLTGGGIPGGIAWIFAGPIANNQIQIGIRTFNPPDNEFIDGQFMIVVHVAPLVP